MPVPQALLIATIVGALVEVCKSLVGRVLVALGISFVTYQGFDATLGWVKSDVISRIGALPPDVVGLLGVLQVDVCINILFSAYMARLGVMGLTNGTITRMVQK